MLSNKKLLTSINSQKHIFLAIISRENKFVVARDGKITAVLNCQKGKTTERLRHRDSHH